MKVRGQLHAPAALATLGNSERWVGLRAVMDAVEYTKILPLSGIDPRYAACRYTD
jgi:hypothetical protein